MLLGVAVSQGTELERLKAIELPELVIANVDVAGAGPP